MNHILYRGYYYDGSYNDTESDTNCYYLQSRYYDSEVGRFINADDISVLGIESVRWFTNGRNYFKEWWLGK